MTPRLYDLHSSWDLAATPWEVWAIIADVNMSWPDWWPHCTFAGPLDRQQPASPSQEDVLKATTAYLNFNAPLGYTLTISIHPTAVRTSSEIAFQAGGDLVGTGRVSLTKGDDETTRMDIEWRVRPTQTWMNVLSPLASPIFTAAHAHMMRQGEKGLGLALAKQRRENGK